MHVLQSLTQELQTLNVEQKEIEDIIKDKIVELEKVLVSLEITIYSKHTN